MSDQFKYQFLSYTFHDSFEVLTTHKSIPQKPGVYCFYDKNDNLLYIGKAVNLYKRIRQYFSANIHKHSKHIQIMISQISYVKFSITEDEHSAFILECELIKQLKPKYNILLKDDKSYAFIALSKYDIFPRIFKIRILQKSINQDYRNSLDLFGPFVNKNLVNQIISEMQKIFKIRTCTNAVFNKRKRPCSLYQINLCSAPCVGHISSREYNAKIKNTKQILLGDKKYIMIQLKQDMIKATNQLDFEQCIKIKEKIELINKLVSILNNQSE